MRFSLLLPATGILLACGLQPVLGKTPTLTGSWKETHRWNAARAGVSYTDTIRIDFLMGNEYVWQKDMGYAYRGTYKATDAALDMGARYFTIVSSAPGRLVLKSDEGSYEFTRYTKPSGATDNSQATNGERAASETGGTINTAELAGKWETFKRTSAVKQDKIDYTRLIKSVTIDLQGGQMTGAAYAAQRTPETGIWNIDRYEGGTIYTTGTDKRAFKVLKCSGGELVLQEGDMTYFFKIFR